jgi:hypothetical protein
MSNPIYGQDEREMWVDMVKRIYAAVFASDNFGNPFELAVDGANIFIEAMREHQKQEGGK